MHSINYKSANKSNSFDSFFDAFFNNNVTNFVGSDDYKSNPAVNIIETDDDFKIEVAAPGIDKDLFDINIEDKTLTISTKEANQKEEKKEKYTRREFSYSSFKRSFTLPKTVDERKISAKYEAGILSISLPKKEEAKPLPARSIKVA